MVSEERLREFRAWLQRQPTSNAGFQQWWQSVDEAGFGDISVDEALAEVEQATKDSQAEIEAMEDYLRLRGN